MLSYHNNLTPLPLYSLQSEQGTYFSCPWDDYCLAGCDVVSLFENLPTFQLLLSLFHCLKHTDTKSFQKATIKFLPTYTTARSKNTVFITVTNKHHLCMRDALYILATLVCVVVIFSSSFVCWNVPTFRRTRYTAAASGWTKALAMCVRCWIGLNKRSARSNSMSDWTVMSHVKVGRQIRQEKIWGEYLGLKKKKREHHGKIKSVLIS